MIGPGLHCATPLCNVSLRIACLFMFVGYICLFCLCVCVYEKVGRCILVLITIMWPVAKCSVVDCVHVTYSVILTVSE